MSTNLTETARNHDDIAGTLEYVLRLAGDPRVKTIPVVRTANVHLIVHEIHMAQQNPLFPHFLDTIDPSRFHSETKLLPEYARAILEEAVNLYAGGTY